MTRLTLRRSTRQSFFVAEFRHFFNRYFDSKRHLSPLGTRRVSAPNGHGRSDERFAAFGRKVGDARERSAQISFHIDGERFQGRNVKHAAPSFLWWTRREHQPFQAPQKRRERFAAARRSEDECPVAACNRRPAELLRTGRLMKCSLEPVANRWMK